jgi:hypothetical protein
MLLSCGRGSAACVKAAGIELYAIFGKEYITMTD